MSASNKHVLDYEGLQYFKAKIYSDLKTINGAAITGGGNLSLVVANSAITGATKCKITYDSKGLVTAGADLAASDLPSNYGDSKNPYASKTANYVLAAPNGSAGAPSFRALVAADIPSLAASKINSGTFDAARIPSLAISKITDLQTTLDAKLAVKPDGTNNLIDNNKISTKYLPDVVLGQLIFGGTATGAGVATLSTNAKTKLGTTSSSITLTNNTTAITGYKANEGIFYVVTSDGSFASLGLKTGDWLISTGDAWRKVDNTDEVTSVQIKGTANVLSSSTATAQTGAVVTTLNLVAGHGDTVNPYGSKTANYVLAAPNGSAGAPSFRALVAADIPSLAASKITSGTFDAARIPSLAISKITNLQTSLDAKVAANTAITGATKCKITYDSKGLVTAGADLAASDIPDLSDIYATVDYVKDATTVKLEPTTWNTKTWSGLTSFSGGSSIWTDGENIYYSNSTDQYVLNKSTSTWITKTWSGALSGFKGNNIWTDGTNIYYSQNSSQYVLDKSTSTWSAKTWSGLTSFNGNMIWTDGDNIYYSNGSTQYVLDKSTSTWSRKTWSGLTSFDGGSSIWTDGENIYYSYSNRKQYVLDKSTSTWSAKTWNGFVPAFAFNVWTDGENIYYSSSTDQYVLNKSTSTWSVKTWSDLTSFDGQYIWTDGTNIYYSQSTDHYVLKQESVPVVGYVKDLPTKEYIDSLIISAINANY